MTKRAKVGQGSRGASAKPPDSTNDSDGDGQTGRPQRARRVPARFSGGSDAFNRSREPSATGARSNSAAAKERTVTPAPAPTRRIRTQKPKEVPKPSVKTAKKTTRAKKARTSDSEPAPKRRRQQTGSTSDRRQRRDVTLEFSTDSDSDEANHENQPSTSGRVDVEVSDSEISSISSVDPNFPHEITPDREESVIVIDSDTESQIPSSSTTRRQTTAEVITLDDDSDGSSSDIVCLDDEDEQPTASAVNASTNDGDGASSEVADVASEMNVDAPETNEAVSNDVAETSNHAASSQGSDEDEDVDEEEEDYISEMEVDIPEPPPFIQRRHVILDSPSETLKPVVLPTKPHKKQKKKKKKNKFLRPQPNQPRRRRRKAKNSDSEDSDISDDDGGNGGVYLAGAGVFTAPAGQKELPFFGTGQAVYPMAAPRIHDGPMTLMDYMNRSTFLRIAPHERRILEPMIRAHVLKQLDEPLNKHQSVALNREGIKERLNKIEIDTSGVCDACERTGRLEETPAYDPALRETRPHMLITTDSQNVHGTKVVIKNPLFAKGVARLPDLRLNSYNVDKMTTVTFPPHRRRIPHDPIAVHTCQELYGTFESSKRKIVQPASTKYIRPLIICRTVFSIDNLVYQSKILDGMIRKPKFSRRKDIPLRRTASRPPHADATRSSTSRAMGAMRVRISRSCSPLRKYHPGSSKAKAVAVECPYTFDGEIFSAFNGVKPDKDNKSRAFMCLPQTDAGFTAFFHFEGTEQGVLMPARPAGHHAINGFQFKRVDVPIIGKQSLRVFEFSVIEQEVFEYLTRIRYGNLGNTFHEVRPVSKFGAVMPLRALYNYLRLERKTPKEITWRKQQSSKPKDSASAASVRRLEVGSKRPLVPTEPKKEVKRRTPKKVPFSMQDVFKYAGMYAVKIKPPNPKFAVIASYERLKTAKKVQTLLDLLKLGHGLHGICAKQTPEWEKIVQYFELICLNKTGKFSVKENGILFTKVQHVPQKNDKTHLMCVRVKKPMTMFEPVAVNNDIQDFWDQFNLIRVSDSDSKEFDTTPDSDFDWDYSATIFSLSDPQVIFPDKFLFHSFRDVVINDFRKKDISNVIPNSKYLKDKIELHRKKTLALQAVVQNIVKKPTRYKKNYRRWDESSDEETPSPSAQAAMEEDDYEDDQFSDQSYMDFEAPMPAPLPPPAPAPAPVPVEDASSSDPDEGTGLIYEEPDDYDWMHDQIFDTRDTVDTLPGADLNPPLPQPTHVGRSCDCVRDADDLFPCELHPYGTEPKKLTKEYHLDVPVTVVNKPLATVPVRIVPKKKKTANVPKKNGSFYNPKTVPNAVVRNSVFSKYRNILNELCSLEHRCCRRRFERRVHRLREKFILRQLLKKLETSQHASLLRNVMVKRLYLPPSFKIKKKKERQSAFKVVQLALENVPETANTNAATSSDLPLQCEPDNDVIMLEEPTSSSAKTSDSGYVEQYFEKTLKTKPEASTEELRKRNLIRDVELPKSKSPKPLDPQARREQSLQKQQDYVLKTEGKRWIRTEFLKFVFSLGPAKHRGKRTVERQDSDTSIPPVLNDLSEVRALRQAELSQAQKETTVERADVVHSSTSQRSDDAEVMEVDAQNVTVVSESNQSDTDVGVLDDVQAVAAEDESVELVTQSGSSADVLDLPEAVVDTHDSDAVPMEVDEVQIVSPSPSCDIVQPAKSPTQAAKDPEPEVVVIEPETEIASSSLSLKKSKKQQRREVMERAWDELIRSLTRLDQQRRKKPEPIVPIVVKLPKRYLDNIHAFLGNLDDPWKDFIARTFTAMRTFIRQRYKFKTDIFLKTDPDCAYRPLVADQSEESLEAMDSYMNHNTWEFWRACRSVHDKLDYKSNVSTVARLARCAKVESQLIELELNRSPKTKTLKRSQSLDPVLIRFARDNVFKPVNPMRWNWESPDPYTGVERYMAHEYKLDPASRPSHPTRAISVESLPDEVSKCFFECFV